MMILTNKLTPRAICGKILEVSEITSSVIYNIAREFEHSTVIPFFDSSEEAAKIKEFLEGQLMAALEGDDYIEKVYVWAYRNDITNLIDGSWYTNEPIPNIPGVKLIVFELEDEIKIKAYQIQEVSHE